MEIGLGKGKRGGNIGGPWPIDSAPNQKKTRPDADVSPVLRKLGGPRPFSSSSPCP